MPLGLIVFIAWMAFMAITTGAFIMWAWKDDQFKDDINYRMLIDREPEPWPGREKSKQKQIGKTNNHGGG